MGEVEEENDKFKAILYLVLNLKPAEKTSKKKTPKQTNTKQTKNRQNNLTVTTKQFYFIKFTSDTNLGLYPKYWYCPFRRFCNHFVSLKLCL